MTLQEAIEEVKRVTSECDPWTGYEFLQYGDDEPSNVDNAIATILNAVVKGELK